MPFFFPIHSLFFVVVLNPTYYSDRDFDKKSGILARLLEPPQRREPATRQKMKGKYSRILKDKYSSLIKANHNPYIQRIIMYIYFLLYL